MEDMLIKLLYLLIMLMDNLDYFVARSFEKEPSRKYDAPSSDKNIIGFENMINWNIPVVLCEGAFDAIAIKRNAIPLFGKNISKKVDAKNSYI